MSVTKFDGEKYIHIDFHSTKYYVTVISLRNNHIANKIVSSINF